jgi:hypothetical protein
MTEDWGFFERRTDTELMRILINCEWRTDAPLDRLPELLSVTVNLYSVGKSRAARQDAVARLTRLEAELEQALTDAVYIGRINTPSRLEYYYYGREGTGGLPQLREVLGRYPDLRIQAYSKLDSDWSFYRYLLPNDLEELLIHNAQMVYALVHKGDKIEKPRNVYHWLLFKDSGNRDHIGQKLKRLGYRIEEMKPDETKLGETKPGFPYPLVISRYEDVKLETINGRVQELYSLLRGSGGIYDGWGSVMKHTALQRLRIGGKRLFDALLSVFRKDTAGSSSVKRQ